tara:strand:+ start:100 stop:600 length:501 start_codon:yes stop_codon:yes gene_type:complete
MCDPYADLVIQKELRNLLVCYGVEKVNMSWVGLLTDLEAQIKSFRKREDAVEDPTVLFPPLPTPVPKPTPAPPVSPVAPVVVAVEGVDKKTAHKNAILKKRAELTEQNVEGRTLLTEANIKKWISEGLTYWKIAELTGVWDAEVSALAKNLGIQSAVSKTIAFKKK